MHLLVPRSRSSAKVKVKYKGYIFLKNGRFGGIIVFHKHILFSLFFFFLNHKVYHVKGRLGYATQDSFHDGIFVERTSYSM